MVEDVDALQTLVGEAGGSVLALPVIQTGGDVGRDAHAHGDDEGIVDEGSLGVGEGIVAGVDVVGDLDSLFDGLHVVHDGVRGVAGDEAVLDAGAQEGVAAAACALGLIDNSQMVSFSGNDAVMWLGSSTVAGFPVSFIVVLVIYVIMHILLTKTALGRSIYCVGGNPEAARLSGINSANVLTFCYTLSGFMAALAGIVSIGRSGICNGVNAIQPYDTDAIAACIIGGASFMGGKGTMVGTMLGALIIAVLRNGFSLLSVSSAVQNLVLGLVIIGAVLLDVTRERMAAKARRLAAK